MSEAAELRFYVEKARHAGSPVLEVGCGAGRILLPVCQAGLEAWGLDLQLEGVRRRCAGWPPEVRARLHLAEADLRDFDLDRRFELIYAPAHAFMQLLTVEDQLCALACFHRHLRPSGRLLINLWAPPLAGLADLDAGQPRRVVRKAEGDSRDPRTGERVLACLAAGHLPSVQRLHLDRIFDRLDSQGRIQGRRYLPRVERYAHRWEFVHLLHRAGFVVEQVWGGFEGQDHQGQEEMTFEARLRTPHELEKEIAALERERDLWKGDANP